MRTFCKFYGDPDKVGFDSVVPASGYDLMVMSQDDTPAYRKFKDDVRALNPDIKILGYQMIPHQKPDKEGGPGADVMRELNDVFLMKPDLTPVTQKVGVWDMPMLDYRQAKVQDHLIKACRALIDNYPYDGFFFDNCAIWNWVITDMGYVANSPIHLEIKAALQAALWSVRKNFPNEIIIGNTDQNWQALNGEMNEGRPETMLAEFAPQQGQVYPIMNLYMHDYRDGTIEQGINYAENVGAWFGHRGEKLYQEVLPNPLL